MIFRIMRTRTFFFYGTLQPGCGTGMAEWLESRLGPCTKASAPGALHAVSERNGWYPALIRGRAGQRVAGTLCEVRLGIGDLARLDRYEGHEYRRTVLPVITEQGGQMRALAYCWVGPLPKASVPIASGDFLGWLSATQRTAFTPRRRGL